MLRRRDCTRKCVRVCGAERKCKCDTFVLLLLRSWCRSPRSTDAHWYTSETTSLSCRHRSESERRRGSKPLLWCERDRRHNRCRLSRPGSDTVPRREVRYRCETERRRRGARAASTSHLGSLNVLLVHRNSSVLFVQRNRRVQAVVGVQVRVSRIGGVHCVI